MPTKPAAYGTGEAIVGRIYGAPTRTWDDCLELVQHPVEKLTRKELVEVVAYLGAQLVGARDSLDRNVALAMAQIASVVREFEQRTNGGVA